MSQVMQCQPRLMWPLRSSHSWSLFSVATSWLPMLSLLSNQHLYHSLMLLCRPPHHVKFLRTRPPGRQTSLVPRYLLTWLSRRLPAVHVPHSWMLPCRRSHTVSFSRTFLRSLVLAQCLRFQLMRHCRLLHIVLCNLTLPHNSTSLSSSLAGFSQTVLLIIGILFSVLGSHVVPLPPPGLEQPVPSPEIAAQSQSLTNAGSSHCSTQLPFVSTTHVGTHPVRPAGAKRSASTGKPQLSWPLPSY